jgi:ATP-dependent protease HslVU (ClpYQ) peptidase subunit
MNSKGERTNMTCVVGLIDGDTTYLGADSCASGGWREQTLLHKKVFKLRDTQNAILGFSGTIRDLNLLQYAEDLIDKRDEPDIDHKYIVTKFIPNVIRLFNNNLRNSSDKGIGEFESYFLLGYKNKLWLIESNYSVFETKDNYQAIGCGTNYALGSLHSTNDTDLTPVERIHKALQAASKFSSGVSAPFYIINTENDEVIEFKD